MCTYLQEQNFQYSSHLKKGDIVNVHIFTQESFQTCKDIHKNHFHKSVCTQKRISPEISLFLKFLNKDSNFHRELIFTIKALQLEQPQLFIYLFGVLHCFQHCTGHTTTGSWKGRGNQYIQLVKVLYCKLPTNGKQLPAFPLEVGPGTEPRPQRWEARVLPLSTLCHRGP